MVATDRPASTPPEATAPDATLAAPTPAGATPRAAWVLGGNRIPFARSFGAYNGLSTLDLLTTALDGLVARFGLAGEQVGEVAAGAVLKHSRDFNLTREAVLGSALADTTPAFDVQQACATGMETISSIAAKIRLGQIESGIAGGVDAASDAPVVVGDRLRAALVAAQHARSPQARLAAFARLRSSDLAPVAPTTAEPRTGLSMGEHQAISTAHWGITRAAQDELALASHANLAAAYDAGFFDDLVTAYRGLARDSNLRTDSSLEKLAALPPVFGRGLATPATMTAGNSTPLTDGASAVLLGSAQWAAAHGLRPLAQVVDAQVTAVDFVHGDEGLLMAPAYAVPALLARNGLGLDDLAVIEIHEAFAATVLCHLAAWESEEFGRTRLGLPGAFGTVDRTRLNTHGGSLAAGHPFAATGGRIVAGAAKAIAQRYEAAPAAGPVRALVSVCAAGGLGFAMLLQAGPLPTT